MNPKTVIKATLSLGMALSGVGASAQLEVDYRASLTVNGGSGDFAPYYIASNRHGVLSQAYDGLFQLGFWKPLKTDRRFNYGFGVDVWSGASSSVDYKRFDGPSEKWVTNSQHPAYMWVQQLYGEVKYRGVFLTVGIKEHQSALLNNTLTSGDLVESGNARPIPELRAGFVDFQDIPFTNGWVQIQGEISYGKFSDNNWLKHHYNYYNGHLALGGLYTYKRAYFRTKPTERFSVTIGAQAAGLFGGETTYYYNGKVTQTQKHPHGVSDYFEMFIPKLSSEEGFVMGNHLGSWDFMATYRLKNDSELKAYFQWPWEDGSGIGKLNGFDGLWGIEYKASERSVVSGAVIEYLDFTNQSGPIHWEPGDSPGTTITANATGGDEYYNNGFYKSYANYGMSIGTPFLRSPIYNTDGYYGFIDNRVRGFHVGVLGAVSKSVDYRVMFSYRKGWGSGRLPRSKPVTDTSMMVEANWAVPRVKGLGVKGQLAFDAGSMDGDLFGACVTVSYDGLFKFKKR